VADTLRVGIVGAGIIGCSAAFELAARGARVEVFDSRAAGGGASQASAGILAPLVEGHDAHALLEIGVRSLEAYDAFVARVRATTDVPAFEYRRSGTIELADTPERAVLLRERASTVAGMRLEWVDGSALRSMEPAVSASSVPGGLLCRAHGFVAVRPFLDALVAAAEHFGATFHRSAAVRAITTTSASCTVHAEREVHFDRIVMSAGAWESTVDFPDDSRPRVYPIKGQLLVLRWKGPPIDRVLWASGCYVVPQSDSTLLVGATSEDVGFDERPTARGVAGLLEAVTRLMPATADAELVGVRVGLRPATHDGLPVVRPSTADPRVFLATGHYRNGVLLAPLTATSIADYFFTGATDPISRIGA
jgi:glycine oxidase